MSRVVLLIGGGSGIGEASAEALARVGLTLAIADRSADAASAVAGRLSGGTRRSYEVEVSDEASVSSLFTRVEDELGPVAAVVNFAGIGGFVEGKRPQLKDTDLSMWNDVFAINAAGSFLCVREMLRRRAKCPVEHGRIVLIGSSAAEDGGRNSPPAYVASKGAVHALTKAAVNEAAVLGITINTIAPGAVDTPLLRSVLPAERDAAAFAGTPLGRAGRSEEIAAAVVFLVSPEASYVTGARIDVNGGLRVT